MVAERYNSEDVEETLKSCTMADWLDDMLNTPDDPLARDILDDWRDKEIAAWTRILEVLEAMAEREAQGHEVIYKHR